MKELFSFFEAFPLKCLSQVHFNTLFTIIKSGSKDNLHDFFELGGV
jgi:hypothetical protein